MSGSVAPLDCISRVRITLHILVARIVYTLTACTVLYYKSLAMPQHSEQVDISTGTRKPNVAFKASRLTPTTFVIIEHSDIYGEQPVICVKVVPDSDTILIVDTGCGGATDNPEIEVKSLRVFLETVNVRDNDDKPINEGSRKKYIVVLTHCHYDHIRTSHR